MIVDPGATKPDGSSVQAALLPAGMLCGLGVAHLLIDRFG
jgi:hypothetical protein